MTISGPSAPSGVSGAQPVLEVEGVSRRLGGVAALTRVSLAARSGEVLGVIGPNGAGKTTLFNIISGADKPDEGDILLHGERITGLPMHAIARRGVARTFQLASIFPSFTVFENLSVAAHLLAPPRLGGELIHTRRARRARAEVEASATRTLTLLGLEGVRDVEAGALPYGLRKALTVGIALVGDPSLVLLDEPVAGMDQREMNATRLLIHRLRSDGKSVIIVEHNVDFVLDICDRVAVLTFGEKLAEGSPREIAASPAVIDAYLGMEQPSEQASTGARQS